MSGYSLHSAEKDLDAKRTISIPFLVAAALLIGGGLFTISLWLTYFNWWFFLGLLPLIVGALMLFNPRTGLDRAE